MGTDLTNLTSINAILGQNWCSAEWQQYSLGEFAAIAEL
jgi:hypothetical protein